MIVTYIKCFCCLEFLTEKTTNKLTFEININIFFIIIVVVV